MSVSHLSTHDLLKDVYAPFITIPEAAKICGNHVSTWYQWISDNQMPVPTIMLGKSRRIRLIDLCAFLDEQATKPTLPKSAMKKDTAKRGRPQKFKLSEVYAS